MWNETPYTDFDAASFIIYGTTEITVPAKSKNPNTIVITSTFIKWSV